MREFSSSSTASSYRWAFASASARASIASTRLRSSVETPRSRKPASTPSWAASHSIVSRVGTRLAALDLADVLLREAVAGEIGLRQAGGDAQLAQALAEAGAAPGSVGASAVAEGYSRHEDVRRSETHT